METTLGALIHALGKLDGPEEYILLGNRPNAEWLKSLLGPNQRLVNCPTPRRVARLALNAGCDVLHLPVPPMPFIPWSKSQGSLSLVFTVHDLLHIHHPELYPPGQFAVRDAAHRAGCGQASVVVAISSWVKNDLVHHFQMHPEQIAVIPWAPPTQSYSEPSPSEIKEVQQRYQLEGPFALYPAMVRPHKNHARLLDAIALLRDRHGLKVRLVCTGALQATWKPLSVRYHTLALEDQVKFLGLVPQNALRAIYRLAQFLVFPSMSEGAGVPILEGWQEGLPVACSEVAALPEYVSDAAMLFDPFSVESIASAIARMATDSMLREEYRKRGATRLAGFSWQSVSESYARVYRQAALQRSDADLSARGRVGAGTKRPEVNSCTPLPPAGV